MKVRDWEKWALLLAVIILLSALTHKTVEALAL